MVRLILAVLLMVAAVLAGVACIGPRSDPRLECLDSTDAASQSCVAMRTSGIGTLSYRARPTRPCQASSATNERRANVGRACGKTLASPATPDLRPSLGGISVPVIERPSSDWRDRWFRPHDVQHRAQPGETPRIDASFNVPVVDPLVALAS